MAIDTADKRKSAVNWLLRMLPIPDSLISVADRRHVGGLYRGFTKFVTGVFTDSLFKKLDIDIPISFDLLISRLHGKLEINSDSIFKRFDIGIPVSQDSLFKELDIDITTNFNTIIRLANIGVASSLDSIFKAINVRRLITIDTIIEVEERIILNSYINVSESKESTITVSIDRDSDILTSLSKFSETDSDIFILRHSILDV